MNILSIQSHVSYGRVGNSAAQFVLERLGHTVWPVNTVNFSNHPAYGGHRGRSSSAAEVADLVRGIGERGAFARCDAVLSGYLGLKETGTVVLDAAAQAKAANPKALFVLDPVFGNEEAGVFARPGIPEFFRDRGIARADYVTPNAFELGRLTGTGITDPASARAAAGRLLAQGPRLVLVTGLRHGGTLANLAVTAETAFIAATPVVPVRSEGAGDAFTALFLGHFLQVHDVAKALALATGAIHAVLVETERLQADALALVEAQDALTAPPPVTVDWLP